FEYSIFTSGLLRESSAASAAISKLEADCGVDRRRPSYSCFLIADRNCRAAAQQRVQTIPVAHRTHETERSGSNRAEDAGFFSSPVGFQSCRRHVRCRYRWRTAICNATSRPGRPPERRGSNRVPIVPKVVFERHRYRSSSSTRLRRRRWRDEPSEGKKQRTK